VIELYTAATPNGWKISIMLEELGIDYKVMPINLSEDEQKTPEFLAMNPNGKIPVIRDTENNRVIFESGAILIYLAEKYQKLFPSENKYEVLQWLMFQVGGIGPMMGQANVFVRYFPEKIQPVIDRYQNEVKRLFGVMDKHLATRNFLAGDYSIADIANWSWVHIAYWPGIEIKDFPHLNEWVERIAQRPAAIKGITVPNKIDAEAIKKAGQKLIK
jgi:glutathione S-transferase